MRFLPRNTGLTNTSVTVVDFLAHMNYTFEIESVNGVSGESMVPRQFAIFTIITNQAGKCSPVIPSGYLPVLVTVSLILYHLVSENNTTNKLTKVSMDHQYFNAGN